MASLDAPRLSLAAGWTVVQVTGPAVPGSLRAWCAQVGRLITRGRVVVCDLRQLAGADLGTVDAIARLCLIAQRTGGDLRILTCGTTLEQIWDWVGLGPLGIGGGAGSSGGGDAGGTAAPL